MRALVEDQAAVRRWRAGLCAYFFGIGLSSATWITRTPDVRDALNASTAQMGLVLSGLAVGSLAGVTAAGTLVSRFRPWRMMVCAALLIVAGPLLAALAEALASTFLVAAGLALFGLGTGLSEVAINVESAYLESSSGLTVLPPLHGSFNVGSVVGGLLGIVASARHFPVAAHLGGASVVMALIAGWAMRGIPLRAGTSAQSRPDRPAKSRDLRDKSLLLIGVVILGTAFAEGTANDWLPLIAVDGFGAAKPVASLAFALYSAMMAVGRFSARPILRIFGRVNAIELTTTVGAIGIAAVTVAPTMPFAVAGVMWGLGASLGFPVAISAAGDDPARATARVAVVTVIGYLAFLSGPPILGLLGEAVSLRNAIAVTAVAVIAAGLCASGLRRKA